MSLRKKFMRFVIPSIASMWVCSLYSIVDGIFVARGIGETAMVAVNLSMPFISFIFMIGILLATGTSTLISISLGREDIHEANNYFNQNLAVTIVLTLGLSVLVLCNLDHVVLFLGAGKETMDHMREYVSVIALFAVFFTVSYNLEVQVKANGAPHISVIGVLSCGIMNVILDAYFVLGLHWGVKGAAIATGLAQVTSTFIFILYFLFQSKKLCFGKFRLNLKAYPHIFVLGLSEGFNELSNGLVVFMFNHRIIQIIGEQALPAYTIISYINTLVLMTMVGTSQGMQPLVSYELGAKRSSNCRKLLKYGIAAVLCFSVCSFLFCEINASVLVSVFLSPNSGIYSYSIKALRLYAFAFLLVGLNVVFAGYFTAIEKPAYAFLISVSRSFLFLIGSLFVLSFFFQDSGIWLSSFVSEFLCLILTLSCTAHYLKHRIREEEQ